MGFDDPDDRDLSRREYLRLAGVGAAVGAAGCEAPTSESQGALGEAHETGAYWSGPEGDRPDGAPTGTRYFATDTGRQFVAAGSGWHAQGFAGPHVDAGRIRGVADVVVRNARELEAAFEDLSDGDTIYVASGVYRTNRWLTVDRNDVTVVGQSRHDTLIVPADGADVGGFHVGRDRRVENVALRGLGFHGNPEGTDPSVKRRHAFLVDDARNVTVRDCFATRTAPYHEHDAGGSGFTVRRAAEDVAVVGNYTTDVGDRSIQVAGANVLVRGNRLTEGFDRSISLEVRHPDGRKYYSRNVTVVNNLGRDNSDGSVIGVSQGDPTREGAGNYAIVGNVAVGRHRRLVYLGVSEDARNVTVAGNVGRQGDFDERRSGVYVSGNVSNVAVVGNALHGYSLHGVELDSGGSGFTVANNVVRDPARTGVHVDAREATVTGNVVSGASDAGIDVLGGGATVTNNAVRETGGDGVVLRGEAGPALATGNAVRRAGVGDRGAAGIRVHASNSLVGTNLVDDHRGGAAVVEREAASDNLYVGNRLDEGARWNVGRTDSRFVGNAPERTGPRRAVEVEGRETHIAFEDGYDARPAVEVTPETPARWGVEWERTADGRFAGARLRLETDDDRVPRAHVRVSPP